MKPNGGRRKQSAKSNSDSDEEWKPKANSRTMIQELKLFQSGKNEDWREYEQMKGCPIIQPMAQK